MLKLRLTALKHPKPGSVNVNDRKSFARTIVWLEDQKIRHYNGLDSTGLRNLKNMQAWDWAYQKYKDDVGVPANKTPSEDLLWLLGYAIKLDFLNAPHETYQNITSKDFLNQKCVPESVLPQPEMESEYVWKKMNFQHYDFIKGVRYLGKRLKVPFHPNHLVQLEAIARVLHNAVLPETNERILDPEMLTNFCQEKDVVTNDPVLDSAARILQLLQEQSLHKLHTLVIETIENFNKDKIKQKSQQLQSPRNKCWVGKRPSHTELNKLSNKVLRPTPVQKNRYQPYINVGSENSSEMDKMMLEPSSNDSETLTLNSSCEKSNIPTFPKATGTVKVGIVPYNFPISTLSIDQQRACEHAILRELHTIPENGPQIRFLGCTFRPGWMTMTCADRASKNWLGGIIPYISPWENAKLRLIEKDDLPKKCVATARFFGTDQSAAEILRTLRLQNRTLPTRDWKVLRRVVNDKQTSLTIAMDERSAKLLEDLNCKPFYDLNRVQFLIKKYSYAQPSKKQKNYNVKTSCNRSFRNTRIRACRTCQSVRLRNVTALSAAIRRAVSSRALNRRRFAVVFHVDKGGQKWASLHNLHSPKCDRHAGSTNVFSSKTCTH